MSSLAAIIAVSLITYETFQIARGHRVEAKLNDIDGTTLIALGILTLAGVFALREHTDFQAVSFTLVILLSFIFIFEAIYKWSFYRVPFDPRRMMPQPEIRAFLIQVGTAATVLTGFAEGIFTFKKWSFFWLGLFVIFGVFWYLIGFPQITGQLVFPKVIPIDFTRDMTYLLNRIIKMVLLFAYLTFFPPLRKDPVRATPARNEKRVLG